MNLLPRHRRFLAGSASAALTVLGNLARHRILGRDCLHPLYVVWYVTLRCNMRCLFCDDGTGKKYPEVRYPELNTDEAFRFLSLMRPACPSIYFSGGEPFMRRDFAQLLRYSRELRFWPIFVNTNLSLIDSADDTLRDIDVLVVSLGSTDEDRYDRVLQRPRGWTQRILNNLRSCGRLQAEGGPAVVVNCVVSPGRIEDASLVLDFCRAERLWFSPVPENHGLYVNPELLRDPEYHRLVADIAAARRNGDPIYGSQRGLDVILRARSFKCYPTLTPHVYPNGDLFFPCHPLRQKAANILEKGSFAQAWRRGCEQFSPSPECDNRCHLPCYVSNNQWMEHPLETALENIRVASRLAAANSRKERNLPW